MVIYLGFFCCEDDDEYSNSSTSPPLPTTKTWLLYQSSPPNPYSRDEITTVPPKRSATATALITPVSHHITLGRQVRFLQPQSTPAQPQRLISPTTLTFNAPVSPHHPLGFSLRLPQLLLAPQYTAVYTALHADIFA